MTGVVVSCGRGSAGTAIGGCRDVVGEVSGAPVDVALVTFLVRERRPSRMGDHRRGAL
jgi:hypothetical protein